MAGIHHPVSTDDGQLHDLSELSIREPSAASSPVEGSISTALATARATVSWSAEDIGPEATSFLEHHGNKLDSEDFETRIHIRSFLARTGLDAQLLELDMRDGTLFAELELQYLVDRKVGGEIIYPMHHGLKNYQGQIRVEIANLVFVPATAKPLDETQLKDAIAQRDIDLPDGWTFEESGHLVRIPLHDGQYNAEVIKAIQEHEWPAFFSSGKRFLMKIQERSESPNSFLTPPFDVRDIDIYAEGNYRLILDPHTSDPRVMHSQSPYLKLNEDVKRHVELQTADSCVVAARVNARGKFYDVGERDNSISVRVPESAPQSDVRNGSTRYTLDQLVAKEPQISDLINLVAESRKSGVEGVLIGSEGAFIIPRDVTVASERWAIVAANCREAIDERVIEQIPADVRHTLLNHPAAQAIVHNLQNTSSHYLSHIYACGVLPAPDAMKTMAKHEGAGIGAFFCANLKNLSSGELNAFSGLSLNQSSIEQYSELARKREATIYWQPPQGEIRKLIGPTFVNHSLETFYKELDLVLTVYCSHLDADEFTEAFARQTPELMKRLDGLGLNIGFATGASTGLMKKLSEVASQYSNVQPMGISTLFHDQVPDLTPGMLTICSAGNRRYRQSLLTIMGDSRLALNGGMGTTGELAEDSLDSKFGFVVPAPIGVVDLAELNNWKHLLAHYHHIAETPASSPMSPPWVNNLFCDATDLQSFFDDHLRPYIDNPVKWMEANEVPGEVAQMGLESHIANTQFLGRQPAGFLDHAMRYYRIARRR